MCHDTITPNDMRSSMSCAWTGAFLVTGAMACAVWVMLRSRWTHLRICWDFQHQKTFFWVAQAVGWGLPLLFLTLTLPITGVSYRLGPSCVPNQKNSFLTWFGWLIAFGCIAALLTTSTTIFCLWVYLKDIGEHSRRGKGHSTTEQSRTGDESVAPNMESGWESRNSTRRLAWTRVKKVLLMQWRSMLLSTLVIVMVMYYGTVFVKQTNTSLDAESPAKREGLTNWAICMVLNSGDKSKCDALSKILGLDEDAVIAAWFIAGVSRICDQHNPWFTKLTNSSTARGNFHFPPHVPPVDDRRLVVPAPASTLMGSHRKCWTRRLLHHRSQVSKQDDSYRGRNKAHVIRQTTPIRERIRQHRRHRRRRRRK